MDTSIHKRTLASLVYATGALVLGLVAQDYFWRFTSAPTPTDGLLALAAAVALFVVALGPGLLAHRRAASGGASVSWPGGMFRAGEADRISGRRRAWRLLGATAFFVLAGAAILASLYLFREELQPQLRWLLYLAAIMLFLAAVYALQPSDPGAVVKQDLLRHYSSGIPMPRPGTPQSTNAPLAHVRWHVAALIAILAIGAFFRLYRFAELPYGLWYDEADNGLWARQILANPEFKPIFVSSTNLPAHFLYLVALAFRLLGDSMYAIRAVAVLFGMLTIWAAYACGRELGGEGATGRAFGLLLAFLVAVSRWDVNWSRIGMHGVTLPFFRVVGRRFPAARPAHPPPGRFWLGGPGPGSRALLLQSLSRLSLCPGRVPAGLWSALAA